VVKIDGEARKARKGDAYVRTQGCDQPFCRSRPNAETAVFFQSFDVLSVVLLCIKVSSAVRMSEWISRLEDFI
jgi:hypothetical protein